MREMHTTIRGNVTKAPAPCNGNTGAQVRVAVNSTYFDRETQQWADRKPEFITVFAHGKLSQNILGSLTKGQPIIATGRMGSSEWTREDGTTGYSLVLQADSLGHDLTYGTSSFQKSPRPDTDVPEIDRSTGEIIDRDRDASRGEEESLTDRELTGDTVSVGAPF